jgi:hypothetical protein
MTKKLEEIFNIENEEPVTEAEAKQSIPVKKDFIQEVDSAIDKIDTALPRVRDLDDTSDKELDDLADLATDKFNDLMDLGMNVDSRFSGNIFQTASQLLGHAITAKQAKLDRKLRTVDLQIKKLRLDKQSQKDGTNEEAEIEGKGVVLDRNALLQEILKNNK